MTPATAVAKAAANSERITSLHYRVTGTVPEKGRLEAEASMHTEPAVMKMKMNATEQGRDGQLDNALMESQIGLYKTELIKPRKPWHGLADVELATAEWVDWFNSQRLHSATGDIPPHEYETNHYAQYQPHPTAGVNA
ncbi:hypothetical protein SAURM35S_01661 [Streptomyces aurantiogriseus]